MVDVPVSELGAWLLSSSWIFAVGAYAVSFRTTTVTRWLLALVVLLAPALCPTRGVWSTVITAFAVVIAARLPDLEEKRARTRRLELALWLAIPVVASLPDSANARARQRRRAPKTLLRALGKRLLWEPFGLLMAGTDGSSVPWPVKSALLVLWFVLNMTALADLVIAASQLIGCTVDEPFEWPLLSSSPREFWSRRWNRFISRFLLRFVLMPVVRRDRKTWGILAVFLASGLFHEYFALGASGRGTAPLSMLAFFALQGGVVFVGARTPLPNRLPRALGVLATAVWMTLTAPLFFRPLAPPLLDLGYSPTWLPLSP